VLDYERVVQLRPHNVLLRFSVAFPRGTIQNPWVDGAANYQNGQFTRFDVERVRAEVARRADLLWHDC